MGPKFHTTDTTYTANYNQSCMVIIYTPECIYLVPGNIISFTTNMYII